VEGTFFAVYHEVCGHSPDIVVHLTTARFIVDIASKTAFTSHRFCCRHQGFRAGRSAFRLEDLLPELRRAEMVDPFAASGKVSVTDKHQVWKRWPNGNTRRTQSGSHKAEHVVDEFHMTCAGSVSRAYLMQLQAYPREKGCVASCDCYQSAAAYARRLAEYSRVRVDTVKSEVSLWR
jgi:hypothetical protein